MIRVRAYNTHRRYRIRIRETQLVARRVLRGEGLAHADITIVCVADRRMLALNGRYLNHWYATDVLSFPLSEPRSPRLDGELYINVDQARRQARALGLTLGSEVARLVVHGILHLTGWDDRTRVKKEQMTRMEDQYLKEMNYI